MATVKAGLSWLRSQRAVAFVLLAAVATAGCQLRVTPDGGVAYRYTNNGPGGVGVFAPPASGANEREIIWDGVGANEANTTACATVSGLRYPDQPGIVVHLNDDRFESVSMNVFDYATNVFNFVASDYGTLSSFGQTTVSVWPYFPPPSTFDICVQATSTVVQFVVWLPGTAQPSWGAPGWGGSASIPSGDPTTGVTGFYQGHIWPGTWMTYSNATVDGNPAEPLTNS